VLSRMQALILCPTAAASHVCGGLELRAARECAVTENSGPLAGFSDEEARIAQVRARHEADLLRFPNVVGVDEGIKTRGGERTGDRCIVVYVARKIPRDQLAAGDVLPTELEGVPVDVVEIGPIEALSG
jgi:hypothetical protein